LSYTYSTFVTALSTEAVQLTSDTNWSQILPTLIDDAEQRIYRDLDLISTIVRDPSAALTANSRSFTLPQSLGRFVTVKELSFFTGTYPAGRTPLRPVSLHWIDFVCPSETALTTPSYPQYFAPITDQLFVVGPAPDATYQVEVVGTIRPAPLSATNTTTFLTNYLSDLFLAAAMCSASGFMRNFGAQADDPKMATSWEMQYAQRLASAKPEELRRKFASGDWTSESVGPGPVAAPK
jgi:hypothetical protein